jgi:hypothetical protein
MKIALNYKHQGVGNQMLQALSDHEVVDYSRYPSDTPIPIKEEILISCVPHVDIKYLSDHQKVLMYATDGTAPERFDDWKKVQARPLTRVVIDGDCLLFANMKYYPIKPDYEYVIPLVINPDIMPKYKGTIKKIAVCNRKPIERWNMVAENLFGKPTPLEEFLEGISYEIIHIPEYKTFYETISCFRGAFFFSHSQNCLMLYEMMAMNMPIVGFSHSLTDKPGIIVEKYLHNYSTNKEQIHRMLKNFLDDPKPEFYNTQISFQEVKNLWNKAIKELHEI